MQRVRLVGVIGVTLGEGFKRVLTPWINLAYNQRQTIILKLVWLWEWWFKSTMKYSHSVVPLDWPNSLGLPCDPS
jgi:hypothetical protein